MDDFQIADEKTMQKLSEEYQKKLSEAKIKSLSFSSPLSKEELVCVRTLQNALEKEKDFLLFLFKTKPTPEIDFALDLVQQIFETINRLLSSLVLPCSFNREVQRSFYKATFFSANFNVLKSVRDLTGVEKFDKTDLEKVVTLQLEIFSITYPML